MLEVLGSVARLTPPPPSNRGLTLISVLDIVVVEISDKGSESHTAQNRESRLLFKAA